MSFKEDLDLMKTKTRDIEAEIIDNVKSMMSSLPFTNNADIPATVKQISENIEKTRTKEDLNPFELNYRILELGRIVTDTCARNSLPIIFQAGLTKMPDHIEFLYLPVQKKEGTYPYLEALDKIPAHVATGRDKWLMAIEADVETQMFPFPYMDPNKKSIACIEAAKDIVAFVEESHKKSYFVPEDFVTNLRTKIMFHAFKLSIKDRLLLPRAGTSVNLLLFAELYGAIKMAFLAQETRRAVKNSTSKESIDRALELRFFQAKAVYEEIVAYLSAISGISTMDESTDLIKKVCDELVAALDKAEQPMLLLNMFDFTPKI